MELNLSACLLAGTCVAGGDSDGIRRRERAHAHAYKDIVLESAPRDDGIVPSKLFDWSSLPGYSGYEGVACHLTLTSLSVTRDVHKVEAREATQRRRKRSANLVVVHEPVNRSVRVSAACATLIDAQKLKHRKLANAFR